MGLVWRIQAAAALIFAGILPVQAQVPAEFTNIYYELETYLTNYSSNLDTNWDGSLSGCLMASTLLPATSEGRGWDVAGMGNASKDTNFLNDTVMPYLNALQSLGITAVKFSIQFPVLYQPYYDATNGANFPAGYTNTLAFYRNLVAVLRQRGIKIIIPTQNIVKPSATDYGYESSLNFTQYVEARSVLNQTIAFYLKPDYLLVQVEPDTEAANLPPSLGNLLTDVNTNASMVATFLSDLQAAGLHPTNMIVGAGCGTWQHNYTNFVASFTNMAGLDLLDIHVYPINYRTNGQGVIDCLGRVMDMSNAAHATNTLHPNGMRLGIGECWLLKESDTEFNDTNVDWDTFNGRNTYDFFEPLDREFLLDMIESGYYEQMDFVNPFWTVYYFTNLNYCQMQPVVEALTNLTSDQIGVFLENVNQTNVYPALAANQETAIAQGYSEYISSSPPTLRLTNTSAGSAMLAWTPVAINFVAQRRYHLESTNWDSVTNVPTRTVGQDFTIPVTTTNSREFFRLIQP